MTLIQHSTTYWIVIVAMKTHSQRKAGGVCQRPVFVNRLIPRMFSLRNEIFWDNTMISESEMSYVLQTLSIGDTPTVNRGRERGSEMELSPMSSPLQPFHSH